MRKLIALISILMMMAMPLMAEGSVASSPPTTVALTMTVAEYLTVSATPGTITFTYSAAGGGTATASGPISIVTGWALLPTRTSLTTYQYFTTDGALAGPSGCSSGCYNQSAHANITASVNGGTATLFSNTTPPTGMPAGWYGPNVYTISGAPLQALLTGTHTDTSLLAGVGFGAIAAGSYSGTLNIVAFAP